MVSWGEYMQEAFGVEAGKETERFMDSPEDMKLMKEAIFSPIPLI